MQPEIVKQSGQTNQMSRCQDENKKEATKSERSSLQEI